MNRKLSTLIFIISGTLLNILLMFIFIIGLLAGVTSLLRVLGFEPTHAIYVPGLIAAILGGMVLAFFVYSKITKLIQKKFNIEKHLEPLFRPKRR